MIVQKIIIARVKSSFNIAVTRLLSKKAHRLHILEKGRKVSAENPT